MIKIALAGNPNCGKTTLFNALTGANQYVGNWPGVTVEKIEGKLKGKKDVVVTDLPGIYSLSPYTPEEIVSRDYLAGAEPSVVLNIVDATTLERNLYLTTQIMELGKPVVLALNMMDVFEKGGGRIDSKKLSERLGCAVVECSALKKRGTEAVAEMAVSCAGKSPEKTKMTFGADVERALSEMETLVPAEIPAVQKRWYAVKLLERDSVVMKNLALSAADAEHAEQIAKELERLLDDDTESIITNERYTYISSVVADCVEKKESAADSVSDKIDRVVTNRWLALPIFAAVMFVVYFVSMSWIGAVFTDWANDGLFGDGWRLAGIGTKEYEETAGEYGAALESVGAFIAYADSVGIDTSAVQFLLDKESGEAESMGEAEKSAALSSFAAQFTDETLGVPYTRTDEETLEDSEVFYKVSTYQSGDEELIGLNDAVKVLADYHFATPQPSEFGIWIPGIPVIIGSFLESLNCAEWLSMLILDGIVAGVGAVLGFAPQLFVLFFFLALLENVGYMSRIAFILDRIFRKCGLSGKSFIPVLIGTGCGIPGIMASRTIESANDRRMTIMTTTFIPCGAKTPFIAMIAGAIFGGAAWVATSAYFLGIAAIVVSGIMLKKTKMFAGEPSPFVMELPAYHLPLLSNVLRSMWERGFSFIKKAGTIILLSTILVWFLSFFGWIDGSFQMLTEEQLDASILAHVGGVVAWIFAPLGFGKWQATVASITGLIAKENIVGALGILYSNGDVSLYDAIAAAFTAVSGYAFLAFNLLCAPCFAAMGAIRREMNDTRWFWRAILYQCGFAYVVALIINQFGMVLSGTYTATAVNLIGLVCAVIAVVFIVYMVFRKNPYLKDGHVSV